MNFPVEIKNVMLRALAGKFHVARYEKYFTRVSSRDGENLCALRVPCGLAEGNRLRRNERNKIHELGDGTAFNFALAVNEMQRRPVGNVSCRDPEHEKQPSN